MACWIACYINVVLLLFLPPHLSMESTGQNRPYLMWYWLLMDYASIPARGGPTSWMYRMSVPTDTQMQSIRLCAFYGPPPTILHRK